MDDLTIVSGGYRLSGWTSISVCRGIERIPSGFTIAMTERYPREVGKLLVQPGAPVQVFLGDDLVMTGYLDTYATGLSADGHEVTISGRGKCQDLIDCAHAWPTGQMANVTVEQIAKNLCRGYGISVTAMVDTGPAVPFVNMGWSATPYSVIEEHARYRQLLVYEDNAGDLVLNRATRSLRPGLGAFIGEGFNLESGNTVFSVAQRFSEYVVRSMSTDQFNDLGAGDVQAIFYDPGVPRLRRRSVIAESGDTLGYPMAKARGQWEAARRAGRGTALNVTVNGWRDNGGNLWEPNTLATVVSPTLRVPNVSWLISDVTYRRDMNGTHADLVLMPPAAFEPEPLDLFPTMKDVVGPNG